MQADMAAAQEELAQRTYDATVGGGMVTASVNGKHEVVDLKINPEAVDPDDVEMLQDMVIAAINEAMRTADAEAAAIFLKSANATIRDSKFINNSANYTGALLVKGENTIIDNCLFKDNFAYISAGAVGWSYKKNGIIKNSIFLNNSAVNEGGGAIFWNNATNGQIINSTFCSNTAKPHGGAIFIKNATNFQIIDSTFEANNATNHTIDSTFDKNNATGKGGAVYWFEGNGTIINSTFNRNYAEEDGGAVYLRVQNGILKDSNFTGNKAYYNN